MSKNTNRKKNQMSFFEARIDVERLIPREEMDPEDCESGPMGEYWIEIEANDPGTAEELALDWFYDGHPINFPEHFGISVSVWRQQP